MGAARRPHGADPAARRRHPTPDVSGGGAGVGRASAAADPLRPGPQRARPADRLQEARAHGPCRVRPARHGRVPAARGSARAGPAATADRRRRRPAHRPRRPRRGLPGHLPRLQVAPQEPSAAGRPRLPAASPAGSTPRGTVDGAGRRVAGGLLGLAAHPAADAPGSAHQPTPNDDVAAAAAHRPREGPGQADGGHRPNQGAAARAMHLRPGRAGGAAPAAHRSRAGRLRGPHPIVVGGLVLGPTAVRTGPMAMADPVRRAVGQRPHPPTPGLLGADRRTRRAAQAPDDAYAAAPAGQRHPPPIGQARTCCRRAGTAARTAPSGCWPPARRTPYSRSRSARPAGARPPAHWSRPSPSRTTRAGWRSSTHTATPGPLPPPTSPTTQS